MLVKIFKHDARKHSIGAGCKKVLMALGIKLDAATEDTVGSSVGEKEFVASYFGVKSAAASLWRLGFLPSFDGTTYRLHSGKNGTVIYEVTAKTLQAETKSAPSSAGTNPWLYGGLGVLVILLIPGGTLYLRKHQNNLPRKCKTSLRSPRRLAKPALSQLSYTPTRQADN